MTNREFAAAHEHGAFRFAAEINVIVTLKHRFGGNVKTCHLQQDLDGWVNWDYRPVFHPNPKIKRTVTFDPSIGTRWHTIEDYSPDTKRNFPGLMYWNWWFEDEPHIRFILRNAPSVASAWWQAHVFVIEVPDVEIWYGYAMSVNYGTGEKGWAVWGGQPKSPFSVMIGQRPNVDPGILTP
jgi:hypothetical protein